MPISLSEYMSAKSLKDRDFADLINIHMAKKKVSHRTVEGWRLGRSMPRKDALEAIKVVTDQMVMPNDFIPGPSC